MTPDEAEALDAGIVGALVLDVPPGFLVCTHSLAHRVAYLQFLEEYFEGQVVAVVLVIIRMTNSIAETTIKLKMIEAHADQASDAFRDTKDLLKIVKRVSYAHDTRTLRFIMPNHVSADRWHQFSIFYHGHRLIC